MSKVSKELLEFKQLLMEDELESYIDEDIENLNLDFLIDYIYENEFVLEDLRNYQWNLEFHQFLLLDVLYL